MSLAKLTEDFQRDKDKLRKNYEEKLSEVDRLQQEQCKTIINVARMPPRPNKENMLNITNIEKGRGRLAEAASRLFRLHIDKTGELNAGSFGRRLHKPQRVRPSAFIN